MCMSCVTSAEAIAINATGGLVLAKGALDRVADAARRRHPAERRQAAWDANSAFVRRLGLDAAAVLGPRPVVPVRTELPVGLGLRAVPA
jgi:hypothetical protein